jgi:hypothetical protein
MRGVKRHKTDARPGSTPGRRLGANTPASSSWLVAVWLIILIYSISCNVTYIKNSKNINVNEQMDSIKIHNNLNVKPVKGQVFKEPSMTIEDDSLTVTELLRHHSSGMLDNRMIKNSIYDFEGGDYEEDFDVIGHQVIDDLTMIDEVKNYIKDVDLRLKSQTTDKEKKSESKEVNIGPASDAGVSETEV